uniref:(northern house mosquito) hypothetical protein n=1 Tax=Culex pipiens TaxID=7175 RepID=A0A8D8A6Z6_CULPI
MHLERARLERVPVQLQRGFLQLLQVLHGDRLLVDEEVQPRRQAGHVRGAVRLQHVPRAVGDHVATDDGVVLRERLHGHVFAPVGQRKLGRIARNLTPVLAARVPAQVRQPDLAQELIAETFGRHHLHPLHREVLEAGVQHRGEPVKLLVSLVPLDRVELVLAQVVRAGHRHRVAVVDDIRHVDFRQLQCYHLVAFFHQQRHHHAE